MNRSNMSILEETNKSFRKQMRLLALSWKASKSFKCWTGEGKAYWSARASKCLALAVHYRDLSNRKPVGRWD